MQKINFGQLCFCLLRKESHSFAEEIVVIGIMHTSKDCSVILQFKNYDLCLSLQ